MTGFSASCRNASPFAAPNAIFILVNQERGSKTPGTVENYHRYLSSRTCRKMWEPENFKRFGSCKSHQQKKLRKSRKTSIRHIDSKIFKLHDWADKFGTVWLITRYYLHGPQKSEIKLESTLCFFARIGKNSSEDQFSHFLIFSGGLHLYTREIWDINCWKNSGQLTIKFYSAVIW